MKFRTAQALAGLIKCMCCNGTIMQLRCKGRDYYGCCNARKESCKNQLWIPRRQIEIIILNDLKEKFLAFGNFEYMHESQEREQSIENYPYYVAHTSIQMLALLNDEI